MEEIKEKLYEQENEMRSLKEFVMKTFKGMENVSFQSQKNFSDNSTTSTAADDYETNKDEMASDDINIGTEYQTRPVLPLPVPNLF